MKTLLVNLFAGPGAGKSTQAHGLMYRLKMEGYNCETALEYAKDLTWEERFETLTNQPYVFGKQYHRIKRLEGKVQIIITDSPLLLGLYYGYKEPPSFRQTVKDYHKSFWSVNFFVRRLKQYEQAGRNQNEDEAREIDIAVNEIWFNYCQIRYVIDGNEQGLEQLLKHVKEEYERGL